MRLSGKYISILIATGLIIFSAMISACSSSADKKTAKTEKPSNSGTFKVPEIPLVINTPELRTDYLMQHYWDNFNFSDTASLRNQEVSEQAYADFLNLSMQIPFEKAVKGMTCLMEKAKVNSKMLLHFHNLGEKYLYDPNSPVRNEVLYEIDLATVINSDVVDDTHKIRPQRQYEIILRNKVGNKATDFTCTFKDGTSSNLYSIKADMLLIYFHNPGCDDCKIVREKLLASSAIQNLISNGTMKVLAVYPDDDLSEWNKHYNDIPANWINTYNKDAVVKNNDIYDLKAIPTLYLLDKDKTVLLKDARFEQLEAYILNN